MNITGYITKHTMLKERNLIKLIARREGWKPTNSFLEKHWFTIVVVVSGIVLILKAIIWN